MPPQALGARRWDESWDLEGGRRPGDPFGRPPAVVFLEGRKTTVSGTWAITVRPPSLPHDSIGVEDAHPSTKALGVRIAIDDFGTGYSSLAYLRQFPADALKIDRSFIRDIASSKQSTALIHTLVQLGKTLHIETLAEGIEDQVQLATLQREHCDHGQGFLFSRPLDVDAVERFLGPAERPDRRALPRLDVGPALGGPPAPVGGGRVE